MAVTIKRIAELAGVSTGTVDRALHDRGRVNPKVAQRIKQIAEELNYQPNSVAKSLSTRNKNMKIAVILHIDVPNSFFFDVYVGILKAKAEIQDFGIGVEIYRCRDFDADCQAALIDQALKDGSSAIAIVPINAPSIREKINGLHAQGFPVVFLSNMIEETECLGFVGCDYWKSGELTAGLLHLLSPNGGKLLLFSPSFQMQGHVLRARGMEQRLLEDYPQIHLQQVYELSGDKIQDYRLTKQAIQAWPDTDMVVCPGAYSDGNLQALMEDARQIGRNTVCYDDSTEVDALIGSRKIQAAILQSPQDQGYIAVKTLFDYLVAGKRPKAQNNYVRLMILIKENLLEADLARQEYQQGALGTL